MDARSEAARLMGSVKSVAKLKAARENGKLGGRPRAARCERCRSISTETVTTKFGNEHLCAGCASAVRNNGLEL